MADSTPTLPPLLFEPILKPKIWGGRRLARFGKSLPPGAAIGESWELADLPASIPGGQSTIHGGPHDGMTLHDLIRSHAASVLGAARPTSDGGFPLLIKFLDARENLSVQVHPDQPYVERHPEAHLKSEAWYIVDAEPGAIIYAGVDPSITASTFADHIRDGSVVDDLIQIAVAPGDCHYLPSGTCHALGAGVLVAEVQTPSDTTFRIYDWGRTDRDLHIEQALECIHFGQVREPESTPPMPFDSDGLRTNPLVRCDHFEMERIDAREASKLEVETCGLPEVWMVLAGCVRLPIDGQSRVEARVGRTVLIPASSAARHAILEVGTQLLRISLPSPLKGMIA